MIAVIEAYFLTVHARSDVKPWPWPWPWPEARKCWPWPWPWP